MMEERRGGGGEGGRDAMREVPRDDDVGGRNEGKEGTRRRKTGTTRLT